MRAFDGMIDPVTTGCKVQGGRWVVVVVLVDNLAVRQSLLELFHAFVRDFGVFKEQQFELP